MCADHYYSMARQARQFGRQRNARHSFLREALSGTTYTSTSDTTYEGNCSFDLRLQASDYTFGRYPGGVLALLHIRLQHGIRAA
jgi:hypothetical protein